MLGPSGEGLSNEYLIQTTMSQLFKYNGRWMNLEMLQKIKGEEAAAKQVVVEVVEEVKKPFCDKCDSKGVRHKKECPLYK